MHIKKRGNRAMLYRSSWVAKGTDGNTHGYSKQQYLGSLDLRAEELPLGLRGRLTVEEVDLVMARLIDPARKAAESLAQQEVTRQRDPMWRLEDALRLVKEAGVLSEVALVPDGRVESLRGELQKVRTVLGSRVRPSPSGDPLLEALEALRRAASSVRDGRYGVAPNEGVRGTSTYQTWVQIYREIEGSAGPESLLRALQGAGFAKAKSR